MVGSFIVPPETTLTENPPLGFHFMVNFLVGGVVPNLLDIRFQKVSGISAEIETTDIREGGENIFRHRLPNYVTYNNLILERGMVIGSPLNVEFNVAMSTMEFAPSNVLVILLNADSIPVAGWLFQRAYPVKWSISDLDANNNAIVIDTMELAYARFQSLRI
ncbi:phage tail protein [Okeania sp. SIO2B3]|uniref:phage tail protein n=1 Tax=Okeania sp. SIO2B3 TaxID=2607784 RepID=UPI0013BFFEC1|nr:phage tail protein [Okeania sp. SIO2B3]NET44169.1 phage tail protein [Okeania sp. SIO2B3]